MDICDRTNSPKSPSVLSLPPAYVVRREGTVFTGVCPHLGGGGGQYPKVGTPGQGRYPQPGQDGVPQGKYPPSKVGTPWPGQRGTLR